MIPPLTPEWFQARLGRITGSEVGKILGSEAQRLTYLGNLVSEILTGEVKTFTSKATQWGIEQEASAIALYTWERLAVKPGGLVKVGNRLACTPDGFVTDDGLIEVKCPYQPINHIRCWVVRDLGESQAKQRGFIQGVPKDHYPQIQFNLWLTERTWCDFVSYSPDVPEDKRLYVQTVVKDVGYLEKMEQKVNAFVGELELAIKVMT